MKKFITETLNGIIPLVLNDARFIADASTEMIEAIVTMVSELTTTNSFILTGVVKSGIPANLSAGWVVLNGNIYKVNAQSFPLLGQDESFVFRIVENTIPEGTKIMKPTLTAVDTYYEYTAEVISTDTVLPDDVLWGLKTFSTIIRDINPISTNWIPLVLEDGWEADESLGCAVPSYKLHHDIVYLRGKAIKTGAGTTIVTLPPAICPASTLIINKLISISTAGVVITQETYFNFDAISYIKN